MSQMFNIHQHPHERWTVWDVLRKVQAYEPQIPWPMQDGCYDSRGLVVVPCWDWVEVC